MEEGAGSRLEVRLSGPGVRQGKVSVGDLSLIADAIQTSLERFAERATEGGPSLRRGPRSKEAKMLVGLFVTGIKSGSTVIEFEPSHGQVDLTGERLGASLFREWIDGIQSLEDPARPPPVKFDRGVLSGLHQLHSALARGIDKIEFEWKNHRHTSRGVFDAVTAKRTEALLLLPARNRRSIVGVMLEADFHSPDAAFTVYTTDGQSVRCTAGEEDLGTVLVGLMHMVRISGEAELDPTTGTIRTIRADSVELEGEGELPGYPVVAVHDFWSSPSITTLEERLGIRAYDPKQKGEWEPPTDDEWERYKRAVSDRRRGPPAVQ